MSNPANPLLRRHSIAGIAAAMALFGSALLAAAPPAHAAANDSSATTAALNSLLDQARSARSGSGDDFLPPDQAFRFTASADGKERVHLSWAIAPGYYLYRDRIHISSTEPTVQIGNPEFPAGTVKQDDYFGKQVVYHQALVATVPLTHVSGSVVPLKVIYQGCAEAGLCYPPITKVIFPRFTASQSPQPLNPPKPWELIAMLGGAAAFLMAGFALRKDRKLVSPV